MFLRICCSRYWSIKAVTITSACLFTLYMSKETYALKLIFRFPFTGVVYTDVKKNTSKVIRKSIELAVPVFLPLDFPLS